MTRTPASDISGSESRWPVLAVALVLALATVGAYWNSFNVPFLLDDHAAIADNTSIRDLGRMGDVLLPPITATSSGRPLVNLAFALNYATGGLSVRGYHVGNLLIHLAAGLALFGLVRRTLLSTPLQNRYGAVALPLAACAALIWTLNPLQTEAVTYISQRAESMMGLFYLLTLYAFVRSTTSVAPNRWLGLSAAACFCGFLAKEVMVTAPVLVLLYDRAFVSASLRAAWAQRRWYYITLASAWVLQGFLMYHFVWGYRAVGFDVGVNWLTYALTELRVVVGYLKLAFWPHPLIFDYGTEILVKDPVTVLPYALILVTILAAVVFAWRRSAMAGFLGSWFFLILAPTSTVVPVAEQPMAESRMYVPTVAAAVIVTLLSYSLLRRRAFVVLGLVAATLGVLTVYRNHDYRSELSICEDTLARNPHSSRAHYALGLVLAKTPSRVPEAIAHYEEALRLRPKYAEAHNNLAVEFATAGRTAEAIVHFEEALRLNRIIAQAHNNLANLLARMPDRLADALSHYEDALLIKPDFADAEANLAILLATLPGRLPDAIAHYEAALRLKPDYAEAHNNFATALVNVGRIPEAIAHYEEAVRLKPDLVEAQKNLASELTKIPARLPEAVAHYEAALRLEPNYAVTHYNFATALSKLPGRLPDAIAHAEEAVRLKPDFVDAYNNLASYYVKTDRLEDAIRQLEIAHRLSPTSTRIRDNLEKLKNARAYP